MKNKRVTNPFQKLLFLNIINSILTLKESIAN